MSNEEPPLTEVMLTTIDNPHDPFDDWEKWYFWDRLHGYETSSFLARIAKTSSSLSDADYVLAVEAAIDEIVEENVNGMYRKVTRSVPSS